MPHAVDRKKGARRAARTLLLALVVSACAPASEQAPTASPSVPDTTSPSATPCRSTFLSLREGAGRLSFLIVNSTEVELSSVALPEHFTVAEFGAIGQDRVVLLLERWQSGPAYQIAVAAFRTGEMRVLAAADGPRPRLAILDHERIVLGWPGANLVSSVSVWEPTPTGEPDWTAIDASQGRILFAIGLGPQLEGYAVRGLSGAAKSFTPPAGPAHPFARLTLDGEGVVYPVTDENTTALWRISAAPMEKLIELPGRRLGFLADADNTVLLTQNGERAELLIRAGTGGTTRTSFAAPSHLSGGNLVLSGDSLIVSAGDAQTGTWIAYEVDTRKGDTRAVGNHRPVAVLTAC